MKRLAHFSLALVLLILTNYVVPQTGIPLARAAAANDRAVLVKLTNPDTLPATLGSAILAHRLGIVKLRVPDDWTTAQYLAYLQNLPDVRWAQADAPMRLTTKTLTTTTINDPRAPEETAIDQLQLPTAWSESQGSADITVAIIDTGIDGQHEDLAGRVLAGHNFITDTAIAAGASSDDNGHGTAMAGIIGAAGNNAKGIAGIAWRVSLIPLKVADADGGATASRVASAITYAADHGAKILNLSLGASGDFQAVHDAITYAANRDVVMVAAAGNDGTTGVLFPAAYPEVIAVGSVGSNDVHSAFSDSGPELDLVAPGENILSTSLSSTHNTYKSATGTSMAAPFVSGAAALLVSRFSGLNRVQVQSLLEAQADTVAGMNGATYTPVYGHGRLNAARLLSIHAEFINQNANPILTPGQSHQFIVYLRNVGAMTWQKGMVNLATDRNADRTPIFTRDDLVYHSSPGWISSNRIAFLEDSVPAGEVASFVFWYTVPTTISPGTYREYFRPVADGLKRLEDMGIYWDIQTKSLADSYQATFVAQNSYPTLAPGQSYQLQVQLRNTGTTTWDSSVVKLGTDQSHDRIPRFLREDSVTNKPSGWIASNRVGMLETTVPPGEVGTFYFWYTVPATLPVGTYREAFSPVAENITWMNMGIYWEITVAAIR